MIAEAINTVGQALDMLLSMGMEIPNAYGIWSVYDASFNGDGLIMALDSNAALIEYARSKRDLALHRQDGASNRTRAFPGYSSFSSACKIRQAMLDEWDLQVMQKQNKEVTQ